MPTYVYECAKCGDELEVWQSFSEDPLKRHSGCGGKLTKVLQPVGIVFKGSGFHKTDSRNGAKKGAKDSGPKDSSGSEAKDPGTKDSSTKDSGTKDSSGSEAKTPAPAA